MVKTERYLRGEDVDQSVKVRGGLGGWGFGLTPCEPAITYFTTSFCENMGDQDDMMLPFVFDLRSSQLHFVDDESGLEGLERAMADCVVVGIDTETKPFFSRKLNKFLGGRNPTALIQLATRSSIGLEAVYIVDMLTISKNCLLCTLDRILGKILIDENCIKVGQSLSNDFKELSNAYPSVKAFTDVRSIVDTTTIVKVLQPELTQTVSLKNMVKNYLHYNLIKNQQLSDWSHRPLSSSQIHYAACDALVLLRLYDAMLCEAEEIAISNDTVFDLKSCMENFSVPASLDYGSTDGSVCSDCSSTDAALSNRKKSGTKANNKMKRANISGRSSPRKLPRLEQESPVHVRFDQPRSANDVK